MIDDHVVYIDDDEFAFFLSPHLIPISVFTLTHLNFKQLQSQVNFNSYYKNSINHISITQLMFLFFHTNVEIEWRLKALNDGDMRT